MLFAFSSTIAFAQDGPPPPDGQADGNSPPPFRQRRPPMERAFRMGPPGRWWNNPEFAGRLGLTQDQENRMEAVFQQNRLTLIDRSAALQKEETVMGPLLSADQPDEARVLAQIDRITQARAELEKANARMLLGMRRILTQDQWKKLQAEDAAHRPHMGPRGHEGPPPN